MKYAIRLVIRLVLIHLVACLCLSSLAKADTIKDVTQELKQGSVLTLKQNVASIWASNLLNAQAEASYASAESLQLSINAVFKAIGLEQSLAGLSWCGLTNCVWVNAQSLVAIDPNADGTITPQFVSFGAVLVTPEPPTWLLFVGSMGAWVGAMLLGARKPKNS